MPKFLDAPSWYDESGALKTIEGTRNLIVGGLLRQISVPITYDSLSGQGTQFGWVLTEGKKGQVCVSMGSAGPQWLDGVSTSNNTLMCTASDTLAWTRFPVASLYIIGGANSYSDNCSIYTVVPYDQYCTNDEEGAVSALGTLLKYNGYATSTTMASGYYEASSVDVCPITGIYLNANAKISFSYILKNGTRGTYTPPYIISATFSRFK